MNRIKSFVEKYLEAEAKLTTVKRLPEMDSYNEALDYYFSFLVKQLQGATGHMPMTELGSEDEYEMLAGYPDDTPRLLFKISEYLHPTYRNTWVAYLSQPNATPDYKSLHDAIIIIEDNGDLKIAKFLLYTNYTDYGHKDAPYRWDDMAGYHDLNLKSLKEPINIERYLEPNKGLELYNENI